jgi:hypothetical protein
MRANFMKAASAFNAVEQEPYQLLSWTILQEPPACREVTVLADLKRGRHPKWFQVARWDLGAASAPASGGKCGRCCEENRPVLYRRLDYSALPQTQSITQTQSIGWHTEWPDERAWIFLRGFTPTAAKRSGLCSG